MVLPILAYGHNILRHKCDPIGNDYPNLTALIDDMWDTMYNAAGCGLAAPQIGVTLRLFVVDSRTTYDNLEDADRKRYFDPDDSGIVETFINPRILDRSEHVWQDDEGCLSIPGLTQAVERSWTIKIEYLDRHLKTQTRSFSGKTARMIQHEFDHIEGVLYLEYLTLLTKKLLTSKLRQITKGKVQVNYPMKFTGKAVV
jgi:peptide deformylase